MIKKVLRNLKRGKENSEITFEELKKTIKNNENIILLDVRSPQEYKEGHLKNAINIPIYELCINMKKIAKNKSDIIIAYCLSGKRSKKAVKELKKCGFKNVYSLYGGIENYSQIEIQ